MEFFDNHSHLNDEKFDNDRDAIIKQIYDSGTTNFITAGYSLESSKKAIEIANKYEFIYAIIGISPNDLPESMEELNNQIEKIRDMAKENKKVLAIGEIGLDYYWNKENKDMQKQAFIKQIKLANELDLPIVIHNRDAIMDTLEILKENKVINTGVFHCCPQNRELIKEGLNLGYYISFAGPITFKNSKNADEMIKLVPNDRILIETDSPYLAPEPVRGTRNTPANVKYIAEKIANVKEISLEEISKITIENTKRIFKIKKKYV